MRIEMVMVCLVGLLAAFPAVAADRTTSPEDTISAESEIPDEQLQVERIYRQPLDRQYRKYLAHRDEYPHFADFMMRSCSRKMGIGAGLAFAGSAFMAVAIGMWVNGNALRDQEEAAAQEDPDEDEDTGGVGFSFPSRGDFLVFFAWLPFFPGVVLMITGTAMLAFWGHRLHQLKKLHPPVSVNLHGSITATGTPMAMLTIRF